MVETEKAERIFALVHTDETREIRDELVDDQGLSVAQANRVMSRQDEQYLAAPAYDHTDLGDDDFERVEVDEPQRPEDDPEVVRSLSEYVDVDVQKTGLVCPACVRDTDEIIW